MFPPPPSNDPSSKDNDDDDTSHGPLAFRSETTFGAPPEATATTQLPVAPMASSLPEPEYTAMPPPPPEQAPASEVAPPPGPMAQTTTPTTSSTTTPVAPRRSVFDSESSDENTPEGAVGYSPHSPGSDSSGSDLMATASAPVMAAPASVQPAVPLMAPPRAVPAPPVLVTAPVAPMPPLPVAAAAAPEKPAALAETVAPLQVGTTAAAAVGTTPQEPEQMDVDPPLAQQQQQPNPASPPDGPRPSPMDTSSDPTVRPPSAPTTTTTTTSVALKASSSPPPVAAPSGHPEPKPETQPATPQHNNDSMPSSSSETPNFSEFLQAMNRPPPQQPVQNPAQHGSNMFAHGTVQTNRNHPNAGAQQPRPMQLVPPYHQNRPQPPGQQQQQQPLAGGVMKELRVEDALLYLDDVKREFGDRPLVYNEFLEIMKNFKSHEVDTPGVIDRVSRLFRGYNKLILGFNKFLPDGYKISLEDLQRREMEETRRHQALAAERQAAAQQQYFPGGTVAQQGGPTNGQAAGHHANGAQQPFPPNPSPPGAQQQPGPGGQVAPSQHNPPAQHAMASGPQMQQQQHGGPPQQPPPPQHQAVEFDHAISYVTNIKKRFSNDPGTYHAFLEILHTYQKEQRGIKEVLEQVAALFADHPDLLKEFTFFLPDAVQEQAKERLHRAAADSEARQAAAARGIDYDQMMEYRGRMQQGSQQKVIDMTSQQLYMETPPPMGRQRTPGSRKRPFSPRDGLMAMQPTQPETFVYNSAVERQFFDAAKEALTAYTRDGGQAWAEFLKCLDMYGQEILSRNEMLNFVEPLLGKRNAELFEEFKRILAAAGAPPGPAPSLEDSWYSVPLSEIDFSRCRRCSPSYRALPRDYPGPPCSDRSEEEAKILNDIWVSLPVGSEESYTFRHMRRNQHEEMLFRCEDERFEIDMVIDSNAATLRRLEPIAEEIAQLSKEEKLTTKLSTEDGLEGGMGGLRFRYTFDKDILGVIHRNSISRIYGDSGPEMLELIVKNPSVAVPVVVQRLRQKDREWCAVRERLNRHWKELAEHNYYRSLDHRSLTWRTVDKRATSTRTLLADIKDRAANGGKESDPAIQARLDKNKEEHGIFFEVTMAEYRRNDLDLTNLPKPDSKLFTPHMSLMYEHDSWAQRDAYRILTFALERGNSSPLDKERFHRFWRDFLGPWFGMSLNWMQQPAVAFQEMALGNGENTPSIVSNGDDSQDDDESRSAEDEDLGKNVVTEVMKKEDEVDQWMDHHPLPAGAVVSTIFGEGRIAQFRRSDSKYIVSLQFGTGYLTPHAVLCTVLTVEKSAYTNQLREEDSSKMERPDDMLVIGTQSLYLFFRLHQILVRRLGIAKDLAYKVPHDRSLKTLVEQMSGEDTGRRRYEAYLSLVYALLDGGGHSAEGKYEDRVRCLLGHHAFELATMDKLISHIVKNIQAMASDDTMQSLVQLFRRHVAAGSFRPDALRQEAAYLSDGEQVYAFQGCKVSDGTDRRMLYIEHLGVIDEESEEETEEAEEGGSSEAMEVEPAVVEAEAEAPAPKRQRRS